MILSNDCWAPCQQLAESEEPWPLHSCLSGLMSAQCWFSEGNANMGGWANSLSHLLTTAATQLSKMSLSLQCPKPRVDSCVLT